MEGGDSIRPSQKSINNNQVKLNIGGTKYITTKTTLTQMGSNFFSRLIEGHIPSSHDEEGYIFIDRNGISFGPILDFLRTGMMVIPPHIPLRSVFLEADFYSIDLKISFCGQLQDGLYISEAVHPDDRRILFIERHPDHFWCFTITGLLKEQTGRTYKLTEFFNLACTAKDGYIECGNFLLEPKRDGISVRQKDCFVERQLIFVSRKGSGQPSLISDVWWIGDVFMPNHQSLQICFVFLEDTVSEEQEKKWIALIKCEGEEPIGPFDLTVLSEQFVVVEGTTDHFWIFVQKKDPPRLVARSPFWKKRDDGSLRSCDGWVRFMPKK